MLLCGVLSADTFVQTHYLFSILSQIKYGFMYFSCVLFKRLSWILRPLPNQITVAGLIQHFLSHIYCTTSGFPSFSTYLHNMGYSGRSASSSCEAQIRVKCALFSTPTIILNIYFQKRVAIKRHFCFLFDKFQPGLHDLFTWIISRYDSQYIHTCWSLKVFQI